MFSQSVQISEYKKAIGNANRFFGNNSPNPKLRNRNIISVNQSVSNA
jgi:hypothetical protein